MSRLRIGIAGAGLLGRLMAWRLSRACHDVSVFDPAPSPMPSFDGQQAAGFTAAGMLSPLAELDNSSVAVAELGWRSIALWQDIVAQLEPTPSLHIQGSLMLAHRQDLGSAQRVLARLRASPAHRPQARAIDAAELAHLEPALHGAAHAWLLPGEGFIDPVSALGALHEQASKASWHWSHPVSEVNPGQLLLGNGQRVGVDLAIDVRGVGARPQWPVRGVRGELVWLQAPGHGLRRPLRLLHPRHRVYVVPRTPDLVLVGASEIESEDRSAVSLRSAVELMSAAHSILPGLAEARILRLDANVRPALPDNEPSILAQDALLRINGLFRHGWLLAPALVSDALRLAGLQDPSAACAPASQECPA